MREQEMYPQVEQYDDYGDPVLSDKKIAMPKSYEERVREIVQEELSKALEKKDEE